MKLYDTSERQPQRGGAIKRVLAATAAVGATAALAFGLYGYHAEPFQHGAGRLLAELTSGKGVQVTFRPRWDAHSAPSSMEMHGVLFPTTAADGSVAFDGRLSYDHAGAQYNFTLLHGKGFVTVQDLASGALQRAACLHKANVPPLHELTDALRAARVVDEVANPQFNLDCTSGKLVEFVFAGEPYVFCSAKGAASVAVHGEDLHASIQLLEANSQGAAPSRASLVAPSSVDVASCELLTETTPTATSSAAKAARALLQSGVQRARDVVDVATGARRLSAMGESDCSACKGGKKQCLFVHGLGYTDGPLTDSFPDYFGAIHEQAACCASVQFLHVDTLNSPWYADAVTDKLCSAAAALGKATNKMAIENVAVVAHSMGNLIMSAALMNGKCGFAPSSKWISLAGPIYGSASAATAVSVFSKIPTAIVQRLCDNDPGTVLDDPIANVLLFFGLCPTRIAIKSIVFQRSSASTPELDALFTRAGETFKAHVSSSLCAVNPVGLLTTDSIQLSLLGVSSGHASLQNDGQVDFGSCHATLDAALYESDWSAGKYYKPNINHLDATFRNGDGFWGSDRKPIKWFNCQF